MLGLCVYKVRARREDSTRDKRKVARGRGRGKGREDTRERRGGLWSSRPPAKILEQGLFCAFVFMLSRPVLYY